MHSHVIEEAADIARIQGRPYAEFMRHRRIDAALADAATRHAGRRALTFISSAELAEAAQSWTYTEFMRDVRRASALFTKLAGSETPRVAMLLPAIPAAYFTLWGGESAGIVCPINYLLGAEHIAELIRASGANVLVALGPHPELDIWSRVPGLRPACPALRHVLAVGGAPGHVDFEAALDSMADAALDIPGLPNVPNAPGTPSAALPDESGNAIAALFHTGGTTGAPKLAQHTHANQLHAAWGAAQMYAMDERDVILNGFPLFHVAGAFVYGLSALLSGAEVVLPTLLGLRNAAFVRRYWSFAERHRVTLLAAVPTVIATLQGTDPSGTDRSAVRALLTGGSPLPSELATAFEQTHGIPVRNILGMTECAGVISIEPFHAPRTPGSCGLPLPFTEVRAVRDDGSLCGAGESGILRVRGPNVGPGYTDARRNAGTFAEDGWLITGDIGHLDSAGRVHVTGRAKDLIIRSSHNIDPQVIEEALLRHPAVLMAAAVGEPDEYAGELPVAFVSLRPGAQVEMAALGEFAQAHIPERPAWPRRIETLPAIPTTAIGKVYKPALRALATEQALAERLARVGLDGSVSVKVRDEASGLQVRFEVAREAPIVGIEPRLRELMKPFALAYAVAAAPAAPAALLPPSAIESWHAHVYFDAASRDAAWALREVINAELAGQMEMGRFHEKPVGPHPMWSFQVAFAAGRFAHIVGWLALNHDALDVFVHPNTGDELRDHRDCALWLGRSHTLNLAALNPEPRG